MAAVVSELPAVHVERRAGVLSYLEALTFRFEPPGENSLVAAVLIYAEPDPNHPGYYRPVLAADTGYEGIACVDDTARAALLALEIFERTRDEHALRLARDWLRFVQYMQYPDGDFANFIRDRHGRRNASGATSIKGGPWWTARALWSLARAHRVTGDQLYLEAYQRCAKPATTDAKIISLLALGEAELYQAHPSADLRLLLRGRADTIIRTGSAYFTDHAGDETVSVWGYHQLHAVARVARLLDAHELLGPCRTTVAQFVEPLVAAKFYYMVGPRVSGARLESPITLYGTKHGLCAYCVSPIVQGLGELYRATGRQRYRRLALKAADWFSGPNDARARLYDPATGMCADGIDNGIVSPNRGAESSIEAGFAEMERRELV